MKVTKLIKVLIAAFTVLAAVNIYFSVLNSAANDEMAQAYETRRVFTLAVYELRLASANLTRATRAYTISGEAFRLDDFARYLPFVTRDGYTWRAFVDNDAPENELNLLSRALGYQTEMREIDMQAIRARQVYGDRELAFEISLQDHYLANRFAFDHAAQELESIMMSRTQAVLDNAIRRTAMANIISQVILALFAVISVGGAVFILHTVKDAMRKEREAGESQQVMLDAAPLGITMFNKDLNTFACNKEAWKMYGVTNKLEYEQLEVTMPPHQPDGRNSMAVFYEKAEEAMRNGYSRDELLCQKRDGTLMPTDLILARVKYKGEDVLIEYATDLTEIKAAMEKEREASELTKTFMDASPMCIEFWDDASYLAYCNQQLLDMLEVSSREKYIELFDELSPEYQPCGTPSPEKFAVFINKAMTEGFVNFEWLHLTSKGELLPMDVTLVRITRQGKHMIVSYSHDLRPIKAAMKRERELEIKLREQEVNKRIQLIMDAGPVCITWYSASRSIIGCNNEAGRLFGFGDKETFIKAFSERFYDFFPVNQPCGTATKDKIRLQFDMIEAQGRACFEFAHLTSSGEALPTEVTLVRVDYDNTFMFVCYLRDLREAKAAEERVREANEFSNALYEASPMFIDVWDEDLNLVGCNNKVCDLLGVASKEEFLNNLAEKYNPKYQPCGTDSVELYTKFFNIGMEEGYVKYPWTHLDVNGNEVPLEVTYVRIVQQGKRVLVGYNYDLRDIRRLEKQQAENQAAALTRTLLDNSPLFIEFWDANGNMLNCNQKMLDTFKVGSTDEFSKRFYEFSAEYQPCGTPTVEKNLEMIAFAVSKGRHRAEWTFVMPDGEALPVDSTWVYVTYQGEPMIIVYSHDLRPIKAAMEKEQRAEERAMLLIDASPAACFLLDRNRQAVDCNQAALDLFVSESGKRLAETYPGNEILQPCGYGFTCKGYERCGRNGCRIRNYLIRNYRNIFPNYEENKEAIEHSMAVCCAEAMLTGAKRFEFHSVTLYGQAIPCEITIVAVSYQEESGFAVYIRDLREEKRREIAEEESRAKTRFLARMSHEIRTPMNAVIGITELQLRNGMHPSETEEAFLRIHNSSNLLLTIINDILDFSKIEADKMEILPAEYELASMIVDTVQLNLMHIGSRRLEFMLKIDERLPAYMIGDEPRIKQILNNLLSNAFKYTNQGHIILSLGMETAEDADEITLLIRVQDTGQGMSQEQLDSLFEIEFTRFNMHSNRAIEGSGLGMIIAHHLITLMGGGITVESAVDKGSTFTVRLPQKPSGDTVLGKDLVESLQNLEITQKSLKKIALFTPEPMPYGRVLLVDDVESNLYVAKGFLMPYKIAVDTATNGHDAVERVKAGEVYDIIFMDHMMPDMDGIEATKAIREIGYKHPVIALTANVVKGVSDIFMQSGFDGFISKPIDLNHFNDCLMRYIRDKQPEEVIKAAMNQRGTLAPAFDSVSGELIDSFLLDAKKAVSLLEPLLHDLTADKKSGQEINADTLKRFVIQAHAMKSAFNNIRELELSKTAYSLEQAGRKGDISVIRAEAPRFLNNLLSIIEKLSPVDEKFNDADEDSGFLHSRLAVILQACEAFDLIAAKDALSELGRKRYSKKTNEHLKEISNNLLYGDYAKAAELAKVLGGHNTDG